MEKRDIRNGIIVGFFVGLLALPILKNLKISSGYFLLLPIIMAILAVIGLYVAKYLSKYIKVLYELAKYIMVGALNTFIDLGVLGFLLWASKLDVEKCILGYAAFKFVSFILRSTNSYFWNKYWTFNRKDRVHKKEVSKFFVVAAIGALINLFITTGLIKIVGNTTSEFTGVIAPFIGVLVAFVWDYLGYKFIIFKK